MQDLYRSMNYKTVTIGWDRENQHTGEVTDLILFRRKASYGSGIKTFGVFLEWFIFTFQTLFKLRNEFHIIHACDLDAALPSFPFRLTGKVFVYDIFDSFAHSRNLPGSIRKLTLFLESTLANLASLSIFPDERRTNQLLITPRNHLVIENVPLLEAPPSIQNVFPKQKEKIRLAYVGTLSEERGLPELLDTVSQLESVELVIAGVGSISPQVLDFSTKYDNIHFLGAVTSSVAVSLIQDSDLNYAMYYTGGKFHDNHVLACPNKFYESLLTATPLLTNKGTIFADKVESLHVGFTITQGVTPLRAFLTQDFSHEAASKMRTNALNLWEKKYAHYYQDLTPRFKKSLELLDQK